MKPLYLALVVALGIASVSSLPYSPSSPVTSLDGSNFKSRIKAAGAALVEFYAPWWVQDRGDASTSLQKHVLSMLLFNIN